jgi:hypothetical protein
MWFACKDLGRLSSNHKLHRALVAFILLFGQSKFYLLLDFWLFYIVVSLSGKIPYIAFNISVVVGIVVYNNDRHMIGALITRYSLPGHSKHSRIVSVLREHTHTHTHTFARVTVFGLFAVAVTAYRLRRPRMP